LTCQAQPGPALGKNKISLTWRLRSEKGIKPQLKFEVIIQAHNYNSNTISITISITITISIIL